MSSTNNKPAAHEDESISELIESMRRSFPAMRYTGKVTPHDGEWLPELTEDTAILEDDKLLYDGLNGRRWTEISDQLLEAVPDGLPLLTDEAFVAFLAAWLIRSLENIHGENEIRHFVVYTFSPRPDMVPDMTWFIIKRIRALNREQRSTVRSILAKFAQNEHSTFIRAHAAKAIELVDNVS